MFRPKSCFPLPRVPHQLPVAPCTLSAEVCFAPKVVSRVVSRCPVYPISFPLPRVPYQLSYVSPQKLFALPRVPYQLPVAPGTLSASRCPVYPIS